MKPRRALIVHPEEPFDGIALRVFNAMLDAGYEVRIAEDPNCPPRQVFVLDPDVPEQMAGTGPSVRFHEGDQN